MVDNKVMEEIVEEYKTEVNDIQFSEFTGDCSSIIENVKDKISQLFIDLKDKLSHVDLSKDSIADILNTFVSDIKEVLNETTNYINAVSSDPRTIEVWEGIKEAYTKVADKVVGACIDAYNYAMSNQEFRQVYEVVERKGKQYYQLATESYRKFTHNPQVRKVVVSARDSLVNFYNNVTKQVEDYLKSNKKEEK